MADEKRPVQPVDGSPKKRLFWSIISDYNLIWNDLSTRNSVLSFFFHSCSSQEAAQVAAGKL